MLYLPYGHKKIQDFLTAQEVLNQAARCLNKTLSGY